MSVPPWSWSSSSSSPEFSSRIRPSLPPPPLPPPTTSMGAEQQQQQQEAAEAKAANKMEEPPATPPPIPIREADFVSVCSELSASWAAPDPRLFPGPLRRAGWLRKRAGYWSAFWPRQWAELRGVSHRPILGPLKVKPSPVGVVVLDLSHPCMVIVLWCALAPSN